MKSKNFYILIVFLLSFLTGCANMKNSENQVHYKQVVSESQVNYIDTTVPSGMSKIYLFMSDTPAGWSWTNVSPRAVIFGNSLVSFMPHPSHIVLTLPPGQYSFKNLQKDGRRWKKKIEDKVTLEPDKVHFFEQSIVLFGDKLVELDVKTANGLIANYPVAQTLHSPYYIAEAGPNHYILSASPIVNADVSASKISPESNQASVIGKEKISDFFAAAGAVALVALFIFGFGMAISASSSPYVPPSLPLVPDRPTVNVIQSQPLSVRSASGKVLNIDANRSDGTIVNRSTGVRYRIEGDYISGTDGSRYRSAGATIFSNNGNYYTKSGNVITSNDGRQCQIIGNLIDCK
ncbi:MAG: hypothetical protein PHI55_05630 [Burkholderiaceae bacterium]|nr:hypothetical protein [Burkholderiaceae bacterium]